MVVEKRKSQGRVQDASPKNPKLASPGSVRYFNQPEGGGGGNPKTGGDRPPFVKKGGGGGGKPFNNGKKFGGGPGGGGGKNFNKGGSEGGDNASPVKATAGGPPAAQGKNFNKNKKKFEKKANKGKNNLAKVSDESKGIRKKPNKKNRFQRIQNAFDQKERSPAACKAAHELEKSLSSKTRVLQIKIQDPPITEETVKSWSSGIGSVEFNKHVEPRQVLVFLKPNANIQKEMANLKKKNFSGGNLIIEEQFDSRSGDKDIDPFSLYITNVSDTVTKEDLKTYFPTAHRMTNVRKHSPKTGYAGKYFFVQFEKEEEALNAFKANHNKEINGKVILIRFRRVQQPKEEVAKVTEGATKPAPPEKTPTKGKEAPTPKGKAVATPKGATPATGKTPDKKKPTPAKNIKLEETDSDEDDDDVDPRGLKGLKNQVDKFMGGGAEEDSDEDDDSAEDEEEDMEMKVKEEDSDDDEDDDLEGESEEEEDESD